MHSAYLQYVCYKSFLFSPFRNFSKGILQESDTMIRILKQVVYLRDDFKKHQWWMQGRCCWVSHSFGQLSSCWSQYKTCLRVIPYGWAWNDIYPTFYNLLTKWPLGMSSLPFRVLTVRIQLESDNSCIDRWGHGQWWVSELVEVKERIDGILHGAGEMIKHLKSHFNQQ